MFTVQLLRRPIAVSMRIKQRSHGATQTCLARRRPAAGFDSTVHCVKCVGVELGAVVLCGVQVSLRR